MKNWIKGGLIGMALGITLGIITSLITIIMKPVILMISFLFLGTVLFCNHLFKCEAGFMGFGGTGMTEAIIGGEIAFTIIVTIVIMIIGALIGIIISKIKSKEKNAHQLLTKSK